MRMGTDRWVGVHWPLVGVAALIALLGVYNLHSSAAAHEPRLYLTQIAWIALGAALVLGSMFFDYRVTEGLAYVFYVVVCLLLLAVLGQGVVVMGARRWLAIGPVQFQPSELAKLGVVFCFARYFAHRLPEGGYSFRTLVRPLNPSRPLGVVVLVALFWSKPWMVDPIGELARFIATQPEPTLGDLLWLRVGLILALCGAAVLGVLWIGAWEAQRALLDPWPATRRRRLIALWLTICAGALALLIVNWNHPWVRDPFGVALVALHRGGSVGPLSTLSPGWVLRAVLCFGAALYAAVSGLAIRQGASDLVDLVIAPIDLLFVPALLVLVQPDLGTAGVVVLVGMTIILVVGVRGRSLVIMGVLGAMLAGISWFGVLKDYQKRRILTFIDPEHDIKGAGWNAIQSMIAVGSGRWWGRGHLGGTQSQLSFLPEQHTDFAFSVWAEEQGFVGCLVVLALYLAFLAIAFSIASNARDTYGGLLATGVAAIVLWQAVINVGMVIGIMPVVGITLPMFSYGGSSLLTVMIGVGVLLNVHYRRRA